MSLPDMWHRPQPGPYYWDYRCRVCSEPIVEHPSLFERLKRRIFGR